MKESLKMYHTALYWKNAENGEPVLCGSGISYYFHTPPTSKYMYIVVSDRKPKHDEWYRVRRDSVAAHDSQWAEPEFEMEGDGHYVRSPKGSLFGLDEFIASGLELDKSYYIWLEEDS